jgi:hypothetical protein
MSIDQFFRPVDHRVVRVNDEFLSLLRGVEVSIMKGCGGVVGDGNLLEETGKLPQASAESWLGKERPGLNLDDSSIGAD